MKEKKKLKISELLLIVVVALLALVFLFFFVFYKNSKGLFETVNAFAVPTLSFGLGGDLSVYTETQKVFSLFTSVFFGASVLGAIGVAITAICRKKYRAIIAALGLIVAAFALTYGASLVIVYGDHLGATKFYYFALLLAAILVALLYVTSIVAMLDALKKEHVCVCKEEEKPAEEKKEEEPAPQPEPEPVKEEPAPAPAPVVAEPAPALEEDEEEGGINGRKIERVPFTDKLAKADDELVSKYKELKEYAESYGVKSRISLDGDSFRLHKVLYMMITIAGKKMKVYYKLDAKQFADSPIPVRDSSEVKKYADVPAQLDVRSELSLKRAKALFDKVMEEAGMSKKESK